MQQNISVKLSQYGNMKQIYTGDAVCVSLNGLLRYFDGRREIME